MVHADPGERSYSLMLRDQGYAIWKPLVGILLLLVGFFVIVPVLALPVLLVAVAVDHEGDLIGAVERTATLDPLTWQGMLYINISLALVTLVTWFIVRTLHQRRPRTLSSVRPGIRWRFFWGCFGLSLVALAAQIVVAEFLPGDPNGLDEGLNTWTPSLTAFAIVVLLTTPLQAIGEEYAFRGYLLQAFGSLVRRPWVGIVLSAFLFACAHLEQNLPLFLDRFVFGLMAGFLVHRTGGLEAGIAMHVWNNLFALGFALLLGDIQEALEVSGVPWSNILLTVTQNGVYLLLVLWLARRMNVRRTTAPAAELPGPPPGSAPVLLPGTPPV